MATYNSQRVSTDWKFKQIHTKDHENLIRDQKGCLNLEFHNYNNLLNLLEIEFINFTIAKMNLNLK